MMEPRPRHGWALLLLCVTQMMLLLDFSIVNVALADIARQLDLNPTVLTWVVSAYALGFGGTLMLGGRMADLLGRRRILVAGLALFGTCSLLGGLATTLWVLVAMRAGQGIGAGLIAPAVLSLITTTFAEGAERNRAVGWFSAAAASGFALGVLIGGVLTEFLGWRSVLFVNVPLVAAAIPLAYRLLAESRTPTAARSYDLLGAATVTAGLALVIYGLTEIPHAGLSVARVQVALGAGLALLAAFIVVEARTAQPLVRLRIFRRRSLAVANLISILVPGVMGAAVLLLSLHLQQVLGQDPLRAGLSFLPLGVTVALTAPVAAILATRFGVKPVLVIGAVLVAGALGLLSLVSGNHSYVSVVLPCMVLAAIGFSAFFATSTVAGTAGVEDHEQGMASALLNTSQQLGTALGVAVLVSLAEQRTASLGPPSTDTLADGFGYAFTVAAGVALFAAVLAAFALPRLPRGQVPDRDAIDTPAAPRQSLDTST